MVYDRKHLFLAYIVGISWAQLGLILAYGLDSGFFLIILKPTPTKVCYFHGRGRAIHGARATQSLFQTSARITSANITLPKVNHTAKPRKKEQGCTLPH